MCVGGGGLLKAKWTKSVHLVRASFKLTGPVAFNWVLYLGDHQAGLKNCTPKNFVPWMIASCPPTTPPTGSQALFILRVPSVRIILVLEAGE